MQHLPSIVKGLRHAVRLCLVHIPSSMSTNYFSDYLEPPTNGTQWDNQDTDTSAHGGSKSDYAEVSSTYWQDGFANPGPLDADHESLQLEPAPVENMPTVSPLDTITQPIHLPPPPLRFPTIVVNRSLDPFIIDHL